MGYTELPTTELPTSAVLRQSLWSEQQDPKTEKTETNFGIVCTLREIFVIELEKKKVKIKLFICSTFFLKK